CTATRSPTAANAPATARPMPRDAPVTSTARPLDSPATLIARIIASAPFAPRRVTASLPTVLPTLDVDLGALRAERLARLQGAMRVHGADVCLFFNQANVRYATGTAAMTVYANGAF